MHVHAHHTIILHSYEWGPAFSGEWRRPLAIPKHTEVQMGLPVSLPKVAAQALFLQANMLPGSKSLSSAGPSYTLSDTYGPCLVLVTKGARAWRSAYLFAHLTIFDVGTSAWYTNAHILVHLVLVYVDIVEVPHTLPLSLYKTLPDDFPCHQVLVCYLAACVIKPWPLEDWHMYELCACLKLCTVFLLTLRHLKSWTLLI